MVANAIYPKAVVAFGGARDGYNGALAFNEADLLEALVTDLYFPLDQRCFSQTIGRFVDERLWRKRFCKGIDSTHVVLSKKALLALTLGFAFRSKRLISLRDRSIGEKARILAWRSQSPLFCYSYYAYRAFETGDKRPSFRFLFQIHPHPLSVRRILQEELERVPLARASLLAEPDLGRSDKAFRELSTEPHLANGWVVASYFTAQSLIENGIPSEKIHVVPYGVNPQDFPERKTPPDFSRPFTVIFVGSMTQRKGLFYLLEGISRLNSSRIRVLLVGRGFVDTELISRFNAPNIEVKVGPSREELVHHIHSSDVFVLPSLVEGFGHVILENMSCGLPVIVTPHTCGPDVIKDGKHGFIVPIRSSEAIAEKLAWGLDHRAELAAMGQAAAEQARLFTWERFRSGIRDAYRQMIDRLKEDGAQSCVD